MATMTSESPTPSAASDTSADESPTAVQRLRDQADAVVQRIQPRIAAVSTYAREEPTKALLISAATGAALMGLVALIVRTSSRPATVPGQARAASLASSTMAAIRDAALDLADRAQVMASAALEAAQQRASDALDSAQQRAASALDTAKARANDALDATRKRASEAFDAQQKRASEAIDDVKKRGTAAASSAADSAVASLGDAWKSVRDQAQPMVDKVKPVVDRVRPQIAAAASYAKEDPARAALGAAAAAALVIGLVALVRRSQDD
jgi:ElaB/YqjD/DUF883 family membrane-anchored ribosome-binding protein